MKAVEREPYAGDVVAVANSGKRDFGASDLDTPTRPYTRHGGVRDLQESSFSLSGKNHQILVFLRLFVGILFILLTEMLLLKLEGMLYFVNAFVTF